MKRIVWQGAKYLIRGRHEFTFQSGDGTVTVCSREVLQGLPTVFGGLFFPVGKFRRMKSDFLRDLKRYAEGRKDERNS